MLDRWEKMYPEQEFGNRRLVPGEGHSTMEERTPMQRAIDSGETRRTEAPVRDELGEAIKRVRGAMEARRVTASGAVSMAIDALQDLRDLERELGIENEPVVALITALLEFSSI